MGQAQLKGGAIDVSSVDLGGVSDEALLSAAAAFIRARPSLKEALLGKLESPVDFEEPGATTPEKLAKAGGVAILYKTPWGAPRIHCRLGDDKPWTQPPGLQLPRSAVEGYGSGWFALRFPAAARLEFLMNDGVPQKWDKQPSGANYQVARSGLWILQDCRLEEWSPGAVPAAKPVDSGYPVPAEPLEGSPVAFAEKKGGVLLLYRTPWQRPHLHFRLGDVLPWTTVPGQAMSRSGFSGFPGSEGWWAMHAPRAVQLEFLANDGGSSWDKAPNDANYRLAAPGAWRLLDGRLEQLGVAAAPPPAVAQAAPPPLPAASALAAAITLADTMTVGESLAQQLSAAGVTLLYRSAWPSPHLHCREAETADWTAMPGLLLPRAGEAICKDLEASPEGGHGSLFALNLPKAKSLEFVINDGGPHFRWDKASSGANFRISGTGLWFLSGGRLEKVLPPPAAPGKPTVLSVSRTSATLSWPAVTSGLKGYKIFCEGKPLATVPGGTTKYVSSGLLASREYSYTVAAVSTQGVQGAASEAVVATTEAAGKPGAPEGLKVAKAGGKGIVLEWSVPEDNGGAPITAYSISRGDKVVATVLMRDIPGSAALLTWTDKDVKEGASYSYTVSACHLPADEKERKAVLKERQDKLAPEDHDILLAIAEELNIGPAAGPVEAEAVDELEVGDCAKDLRKQLKSRGITIFYKTTWDAVYAHCATRPELGWTSLPGMSLVPSPTTAFPSSEGWWVLCLPYARHLELVMNNGAGQWDKAPGGANFKVAVPGVLRLSHGHLDCVAKPPQAPSALVAEALDGSRVSLTWKAAPVADGEAPIMGYKVYRNGRLVTMVQGAACKFVDKNLFAFTDYEYAVAAVNSQDVVGDLCPSTQAKTERPGPPSQPRNLRVSASKENGKLCVSLEWEPPEDCAGAPVASYEILRNGTVISCFEVPSARLRSEAEACQPVDPDAAAERRWVRSTCSYSRLAWFKDALEWTDTTVQMGETYSYQVTAVQLGPDRAGELKKGGLVQRCGSRFLDCVEPDIVGPACEPVEVRAVPFLDPPRLGEQKTMIMFQAFDWGSCKADSWYTILLGLLPELRTAGVNMMWLPPPSDSVDDHGYLPRKWYVLDNKYGTAAALQRLVSAMHEQEICPILDVVVNHRCASAQDSAGRWLKFQEPDWEGWAICSDSPAVPGGSGNRCTGEPAQYAPSVDHQNPKIREDVNAYIRHMMEDVGFRALRFDFVKGYSPNFQRDYVRAAGCPFAVAENWNGDVNGLHGYVRECQGLMAVYDFPLYYVLKRTIHSNNFAELNDGGRLLGIIGRDPARACTFVDNHDTYQLAIVGGAFGNNEQVLRAYAFILTHPGVPCVFHYDYVRGPQVREKILQLCSIRRDAGIHSTSQVQICASGGGLYAAIIGNRVAIKIGTNDWSPGGGWNFSMAGNEFAIWTR